MIGEIQIVMVVEDKIVWVFQWMVFDCVQYLFDFFGGKIDLFDMFVGIVVWVIFWD